MKSFTIILATLFFLSVSELMGCADGLPGWACGKTDAAVQGDASQDATDSAPADLPQCIGVSGESNREEWAHMICGAREHTIPRTCTVCVTEVDNNGMPLVWAAIQFEGLCNCAPPLIHH